MNTPDLNPADIERRFAAVMFDMDGLLIDSERLAVEAFQIECDRHSLGNQFDLYIQLLGTNDRTTRGILEQTLPVQVDLDEFLRSWEQQYQQMTASGVPLLEGVHNLLDFLEIDDIPKAVATSTRTSRAMEKLQSSGIVDRFSIIIGGDQVDQGKPHPEIYERTAEALGVHPRECLVLEDSPNGVRAGVASGATVVQIPQLAPPDADVRALGHTILSSLDDVVTWIQGG